MAAGGTSRLALRGPSFPLTSGEGSLGRRLKKGKVLAE